jgi:alkylation response protein AidB-like acyl-CoA dehydrogenase
VTPRADRRALVELVRRVSVLDEASRAELRAWVDERLEELRATADREIAELFDYRRWYELKLRMDTVGGGGVELTRELRQLGSGGEQGVPNYLLALALAGLLFDTAGSHLRPLFLDEAFYGIDAGRRDQLLRFATDLGLPRFVASPDQDGVSAAVRSATTLFVVKDEHHDVHLAPYHDWNHQRDPQSGLFDPPAAPPAEAVCTIAPASS